MERFCYNICFFDVYIVRTYVHSSPQIAHADHIRIHTVYMYTFVHNTYANDIRTYYHMWVICLSHANAILITCRSYTLYLSHADHMLVTCLLCLQYVCLSHYTLSLQLIVSNGSVSTGTN